VIDAKIAASYLSRTPPGVNVEVAFRIGPEAGTILEFAKASGASIIILGRHGRGGVGKALFGSVAEKVVRKAECPVLVVPLNRVRPASAG
jgi:nucleotide-binding universal stress UspA family protein